MPRIEHFEQIYRAAERYADAALRAGDSLFTPGLPIWSPSTIQDFYDRFVGHPDESSDSFEIKLQRQLAGAPPETVQLAGEALYAYYLAPSNIGADKKRGSINTVLSWSIAPVGIPEDLDSVLESGIASFGPALTNRPFHLALLLELVRQVKGLNRSARDQLLQNPWRFKEMVFSLPGSKANIQRQALLHLMHPETFERALSQYHKPLIADSFAGLVGEPTDDVDRKIFQIRERLSEKYGTDFDFYDDKVKPLWLTKNDVWGTFVRWAKRFYEWEGFDDAERDYKLEVAETFRQARASLLGSQNSWQAALKKAFAPPNNLTDFRQHTPFLDWCKKNPEDAREALRALWGTSGSIENLVRNFMNRLPADAVKGPGGRLALASALAMAIDPSQYPIYRERPFAKAFELTGYAPPKDLNEAGTYEYALTFLDRLCEEAASRGLELRDRLDAQGLLWCVTKWKPEHEPVKSWPSSARKAFLQYRGEKVEDDDEDEVPQDPRQGLAEDLNLGPLGEQYLTQLERLLEDKGQVIFFGPPGTGKTYVARKIAEFYAKRTGGASGLVQFHPSYAYEDFVEGYRPQVIGGQPGFDLVDGPLKDIAEQARKNPDGKYVLVVDEVNRANVTKVFGELYFLLEYRGEKASLQYSKEPFALPENLWLICTMNTADRSIALVDAALRRRFYFFPFFPHEPPVEGLLRRYLAKLRPELLWVAEVLDEANRRLDDRHAAIGPSYFLREDLTEEWVASIWKHAVLPYLAERFFGEEDRLKEFDLGLLRKATAEGVPEGADAPADAE